MHDGMYGRNHLYSYVNDNGTWWKTVDWMVTEASATRLQAIVNFMCCLHLGFGGDRSDGLDRPPPRRRALHAHLQPRHSRRGPRTPAMARKHCGSCTAASFSFSDKHESALLYSGTSSVIMSFSLGKSRRVLLAPRAKPSRFLFRRLRPYPASLRRWKYPSLLESRWTCPTETRGNCRWELRCTSGSVSYCWGPRPPQRPHCYFLCYFSVQTLRFGRCIVEASFGKDDLHRLVSVNPVLPRYHKRCSCAWA